GLAGGHGVAPLEVAAALEPVFRVRGRRLAPRHHRERAGGRVALEVEDVLPRIRLPAPGAVLDHDAIALRLDRQARERHLIREAALELLQRAIDAASRDLRLSERLRGA